MAVQDTDFVTAEGLARAMGNIEFIASTDASGRLDVAAEQASVYDFVMLLMKQPTSTYTGIYTQIIDLSKVSSGISYRMFCGDENRYVDFAVESGATGGGFIIFNHVAVSVDVYGIKL